MSGWPSRQGAAFSSQSTSVGVGSNHKERLPCTLLQCEVRGQGMYASCTGVVYERVVGRKAQWCGGVIMPLVL